MRVMLVEDEPFVALDLETIVTGFGHEVVGIAETRGEAIALARSSHADVAFIDMRLRDGFTGMDVAHHLIAHYGVRCGFVTGNVEQLPANLCGAAGVVAKPFTEAHIGRLLGQLATPA